MKLITNFEKDWEDQLKSKMENDWGMDLSKVLQKDIAILFFHAQGRRVEPRARRVELSKSFSCPLNEQAGWELLKEKIEKGVDLSPHLSLGTQKAEASDHLLFEWGIYHLHLGVGVHPKNPAFQERSGPVLFGIPQKDVFYAVGIYSHGSWSQQAVIDTVHENWPDITQRYTLKGGISLAHVPTDQERQKLRQGNVNVLTALSDGSVVGPIGGGFATSGASIRAVRSADEERSWVRSTQSQLMKYHELIKQHLIGEGFGGTGEVVAKLVISDKTHVAFEGYQTIIPIE